MRHHHNIEPSAFRKGEYVGYAANKIWRITKINSACGKWQAVAPPVEANARYGVLFADRLADLSTQLEAIS